LNINIDISLGWAASLLSATGLAVLSLWRTLQPQAAPATEDPALDFPKVYAYHFAYPADHPDANLAVEGGSYEYFELLLKISRLLAAEPTHFGAEKFEGTTILVKSMESRLRSLSLEDLSLKPAYSGNYKVLEILVATKSHLNVGAWAPQELLSALYTVGAANVSAFLYPAQGGFNEEFLSLNFPRLMRL